MGVVEGDGYITLRRTKGNIGLEVNDRDFALCFKDKLEKWSGLKVKFKITEGQNTRFIVTLHSLRAAQYLKSFDIYCLTNAEENIKSMFLRGFFDAEGGVSGSNLKTPRIATRFIAVFNSDKKLILFVKNLIESLNIKVQNIDIKIGSGFNKNGIYYRLRIGSKENLIKFKQRIGFSIERKNKKLDEVLNSYRK